MKVDFNQVLKDFEGDPLKNDKNKEWTLKTAAVSALATALEEDKGMTADKAVARYKLALRLQEGGEQELSPEEATEIRNRLAKCYSILISGQACEMLKG